MDTSKRTKSIGREVKVHRYTLWQFPKNIHCAVITV